MGQDQTLETDGELDITGSDHVLDFKVFELGRESQFLNDSCIFSGGQPRVFLGFSTGADHLARAEDECCCPGFANSHDDGGKTFGVVLGVSGGERNFLEIQFAPKTHC